MDVHLPPYLYKYLSLRQEFDAYVGDRKKNGFDAIEEIVVDGQIFYSDPRHFNDPFEFERVPLRLTPEIKSEIRDCFIRENLSSDNGLTSLSDEQTSAIKEQVRNRIDELDDQHEADANNLIKRSGYIALSDRNDNVLMWSHYADNHHGVCMRFRCIRDSFYSDGERGRVVKVEYGDGVRVAEMGMSSDDEIDAVFQKISYKARCWEYESEYRIFRSPSNPWADDAQGLHSFNSSLVDTLYIGLRTPDEDLVKLRQIIEKAGHDIEILRSVKRSETLSLEFTAI